ncbi:MAG TPA: adenylate/guanylate cyclase domain-containing protein [Candidatus Limnocylindrales bacterium]|nr:adenylate/guanylate cyclase domain-containing protein [Candidatus Limnocylindrales bacterium]
MSEERRLVTILFADVAGSTALGESLDPEDLRALLGRYYGIARDVVEAHGGTIEKFIGDAAMAVFGLPIAHDDDPNRALSAALELRDRVRDDPRLGDRLPIRLGLQTGEVVAARDPTAADSLVTGDAVNTAARLQQAADTWEILVGERTARASRGFAFESMDSIEAKGKSTAVACRRLTGRVAETTLRVPLVGREGEVAQLELTASRAFRERRPFLVTVLASPGVGKSRLLEEFADRLPALDPAARIALAQCLPYGQRLTYWPLRAIAHAILELPEDASPEDLRAAAVRWLAQRGDPAAERTADVIAATVGGGEVEGIDRSALVDAWRSLVELASADAPLVLAIEDLHWSSDSLLDLIESVLLPRGEAALLMVVLARPELLDRRPTWGGGRRNYVSLSLEPLDDPDVAKLVEHLLDGPSPDIVRLVVDRAEGNPFYAGELVRAIVDRTPDLGATQAVAASLRSLPDTVQATVLARIDVLPLPVRRAIQLGSVFGRSFQPDGLVALEPEIGASVRDAVDELIDRDLVRPSRNGVSFRHILIREVAYSTLPRAERARLHAAAGDWLEARAAGREEEVAELVAYHYREATTLAAMSGDVPQDVASRAVRWLRIAADAAMAGAANLEAAGHIRAAIELAPAAEQAALYERLGDVLISGNDAIDAYARALEIATASGASATDRLRIAAAELLVDTRWMGTVAGLSVERIDELRRLGLDLLPDVSDDAVRARFLGGLAFAPAMVGGVAEVAIASVDAAREADEIAVALGDVDLRSMALDARGALAMAANDMQAAADAAAERLALGDRLDSGERADAYIVRGWSLITLGRVEEGLASVRAVEAMFGPGQVLGYRIGAKGWEVAALHILGRWDEAVVAGRRLLDLWIEYDRSSVGYAVHGFIRVVEIARARRESALEKEFAATARELLGQFEEARTLVGLRLVVDGEYDRVAEGIVDRWREFISRPDEVEIGLAVLADHGLPGGDEVGPIIERTSSLGIRLTEAQARRALGVATDDAAELARAADLYRAMGAPVYLARTEAERAILTGDDAGFDAASAALERLGDIAHAERLAARRAAR